MDFYEVLARVIDVLQREGRTSYRALKRQFDLDDEYLADLKIELIEVKQLAVDQDDQILVWTGETASAPLTVAPATSTPPAQPEVAPETQPAQVEPPPPEPHTPDAERRQLTVMFCDLVGSTPLSEQLDPEDLREVVRAYQQTCAEVVQRFDGHIAQLLGDALLVYFGWPQAHEDDAQRAVRTGLGMLDAMGRLNTRLERDKDIRLAIRVGIHTGLVVVGEMGGGGHQEQLALGETPNVASRLQGIAEPDTVVISDATSRLIEGYFTCQALGAQPLKGIATSMQVYRVLGESGAQSRFEVAATRGLTPLVGREQEVGLLLERWAQVKEGMGQVVLLSGEAGIGKSRLVQVLKDHIAGESHAQQECRCSPYHTNSAFFPLTDLLQRTLHWQQTDTPAEKLRKLETVLTQKHLAVEKAVPLFAPLLALPLPDDRYPSLYVSSQRQRQQTLEAFLTILLALASQHPVVFIVEDLHWIDPSTLEFLDLLIDQVPTASILTLLTCRPTFHPSWGLRTHLTPIALNRFTRRQTTMMVQRITGGKQLPADVLHQIVEKTDGVPLFVEEMTKAVLESGMLKATGDRYEVTRPVRSLTIPATLQDSLMARLDRLISAKGLAQLGATIGRQFSYALVQALMPLDTPALQHGLRQLVEAELLYQRGVPPQATYIFKHALIQDAAYQSLLKSTRQQYHQRIAQALTAQFPETVEHQPELVAHHYTEAGLSEPAVVYWQRAGECATERSAHVEAIAHISKGLEALKTLPDSPEHIQRELTLLTALGPALITALGAAAPDVEHAYARARELCGQEGATPQLFPVLWGLWRFYFNRTAFQTARELGEQLLTLAQRQHDPALLLVARAALGGTLHILGELAQARTYLEQDTTLSGPEQHRVLAVRYGVAPGVLYLSYAAMTLWALGYADQARWRIHEALILARQLSHPPSLAQALYYAAQLHVRRREAHAAYEQTETLITLATEQGFALWLAFGTIYRGWALSEQGDDEAGLAQMRQGLTDALTRGATVVRLSHLTLLVEVCGKEGRVEEGLRMLAEAWTLTDESGPCVYEAEMYRLKGELLLRQAVQDEQQAETCFHQALAVARHQQAKSLELRAAISLARLRQQQGKRQDAYDCLAPVYNWFTEGFDTADLQEAKALLDECG